MHTIFFYSYKGGHGKSLAAANLAVCLSRIGKNCALVDWDIDAPSAHMKFGIGDSPLGQGGIAKLIRDHTPVDDEDWDRTSLSKVEFRPIQDHVTRYTYALDDIRERELIRQKKPAGRIYLLPAGDTYKNSYWDTVWGNLWRQIFTVAHDWDRGRVSDSDYEKVGGFLKDIKGGFKELDPSPEYLIVDCRSGSSALMLTLASTWLEDLQVDRLAYFLTMNDESILYLDRFASMLDNAFIPIVIPVLCRIPTSFEDYAGDTRLKRALYKLKSTPETLSVLHSDRSLEGEERLRLGLNSPPENRMLTKEYLDLFEKLIRPEDLPKEGLPAFLGLTEDSFEEKERLFNLIKAAGRLENPKDGSRNVSFKVETFQLLLEGLESGIAAIQGSGHDLGLVLKAAGAKCGERFGQAMATKNRGVQDSGGPHEKIQRWCSFDSDVGFGRFQLHEDTIETKGQRLIYCAVTLHQSFLAPASDLFKDVKDRRNITEHKFCGLMEGYIEGVLEKLLDLDRESLEVRHIPIPREDRVPADSCRFEIREMQLNIGNQQSGTEGS